jgi:hypothetical protein
MARPAGVQDGRMVELYRMESGGRSASRVRVELGAVSPTIVQVRSGLAEGDRIIVSEVAEPGGVARLRIQ